MNFPWSPCCWVLNNLFHHSLRIRLQSAPVLLQKCGGVMQGPLLQLLQPVSALPCSSAKEVLGIWLKQILAAMQADRDLFTSSLSFSDPWFLTRVYTICNEAIKLTNSSRRRVTFHACTTFFGFDSPKQT